MSNELKKKLNTIRSQQDFLHETYNVKKIGVFGSVVRDDFSKDSDIDILVEYYKVPGFFKFIELEEYLSELLGRQVDLVTKKALKPVIKSDILKQVVYV